MTSYDTPSEEIHGKKHNIVRILSRSAHTPTRHIELFHKEKMVFWLFCVAMLVVSLWMMGWDIDKEAGIPLYIFVISVAIAASYGLLACLSSYFYSHEELPTIDSYWIARFIAWCAYRRFVPYEEAVKNPRFASFSWWLLGIELLMAPIAVAVAAVITSFFDKSS